MALPIETKSVSTSLMKWKGIQLADHKRADRGPGARRSGAWRAASEACGRAVFIVAPDAKTREELERFITIARPGGLVATAPRDDPLGVCAQIVAVKQ